jgi:hypothetical protein
MWSILDYKKPPNKGKGKQNPVTKGDNSSSSSASHNPTHHRQEAEIRKERKK